MNPLNMRGLAYNRFKDDPTTPIKIYMVEGDDFRTKPIGGPYEIDLYKVIQNIIDREVINISGGKEFIEIDNGKSKMHAVTGTTLTNTTQGIFKYTATNFGDIKTVMLAIERVADSKGNGDLDIIFDYTDGQVNTWQPGDAITDIDLFVPTFEVYDWSASLLSVASMSKVTINPEITYNNGEVQLRFLDASNYGTISRLLFIFTF